MLHLYKIVEKSKALGKGERFCLWVQGCDKRCEFCLVPDSWSKIEGGFYLSVDELVEKVISIKGIEGVTISGGEPFLQSEKLLRFVTTIKKINSDLNFIIYTGLNYDDLIKDKTHQNLINEIDLLIDGEYIDELNDNTPLIGSTNQGVYILSDEGEKLALYMKNKNGRDVEFFVEDADDLFMVGIPPKDFNKNLKGII